MWNIVAWVLQAVLALVFLFHGILYTFGPEALVRSMRERGAWPPAIPYSFRMFIGVAELLAAVGLILPGLLHRFTFLTPLAGVGLMIVTVSAAVYHLRRQEVFMVPIVGALFVLAAAVAILRWGAAPL